METRDVCYQNYATHEYNPPKDGKVTKGGVTIPRITKYEYVRVLSTRVQQLAGGAKPMVKDTKGLSHGNIARQEIINGSCPLVIVRYLPSGDIEEWEVGQLRLSKKLVENI